MPTTSKPTVPVAKWWPSTRKGATEVGQEHLYIDRQHTPICSEGIVRISLGGYAGRPLTKCARCRRMLVSRKVTTANA